MRQRSGKSPMSLLPIIAVRGRPSPGTGSTWRGSRRPPVLPTAHAHLTPSPGSPAQGCAGRPSTSRSVSSYLQSVTRCRGGSAPDVKSLRGCASPLVSSPELQPQPGGHITLPSQAPQRGAPASPLPSRPHPPHRPLEAEEGSPEGFRTELRGPPGEEEGGLSALSDNGTASSV